MRILHVTNELAPHGHGGVAEHVWAIARAQSARHDVAIFTRFDDPSLPDGYVYTERRERVTIRFFNRPRFEWSPLERSYVHHDVEAEFKLFLGELRSDVVHFHDMETLGIGLLEIVRSLNIKSVMTARDFWPMCPLKARVCRTDGSTCDTIDLGKCGPCVHGEQWAELRAAELAAHEARRPARDLLPDLEAAVLPALRGHARRDRPPPARAGARHAHRAARSEVEGARAVPREVRRFDRASHGSVHAPSARP